ncbi:head GIN domain-containing protein [Pseudomonas aeruginosa]|nr:MULTISPECIES: head GIN domain-containing protein [Pseudomonas]MCL8303576.1 DUF2807 domain-containing protein [Pseudomonas putida]MCK0981187.1 DUF2807 domain-containing protein [Pseudomonas aeruginosa]MCK1183549.1 DUF2807 domain-containing protein [Pseudomonas aeruginosa]MCL8241875.1 DUF2807 domain-containing protein [Pseudomonas aeruginosa]MCL8271247.1 DUF2807 domain-containing protein [Pseudomonas aeruginosa]
MLRRHRKHLGVFVILATMAGVISFCWGSGTPQPSRSSLTPNTATAQSETEKDRAMTTSFTDFFPENSKWSRPENFIKESRPIHQVKKLIIKGAVDVVFFRDQSPRLVVAGETKEAVERVHTTLSGDKLVIEQEGNVIIAGGGSINISGNGNIVVGRDIRINGVQMQFNGPVGSIDIKGASIGTGRVLVAISLPIAPRVRVKGSGDITLYGLQQDEFEASVQGSGDVTVQGTVQSLEVEVAGSGDVDARELTAATVDLSVAGSGDISAYASQSARARVAGSGDIVVYGNPAQRDHRVAGSGKIKFK